MLSEHTDDADETYKELVQSCCTFPDGERHWFKVKLVEDTWDPLSMFKGSRVIGDGVLEISLFLCSSRTCEVTSLLRPASMYVVGTTRRKY